MKKKTLNLPEEQECSTRCQQARRHHHPPIYTIQPHHFQPPTATTKPKPPRPSRFPQQD